MTPRSPILPQPDTKSPGSTSQKTPTTLSRQGTLRASHRRKNSMTGSLNLYQGRRSPVSGLLEQRSPQGRKSPVFLTQDRARSPSEYPGSFDRRSPTIERKSPTGDKSRSPTFSIHVQDRRSPVGHLSAFDGQRRSPTSTVHVQDGRSYDHTPDESERYSGGIGSSIKRTSIGLFTPIQFGDKRSPVTSMPIPPITVSNPSETCKIVERMADANIIEVAPESDERKLSESDKEAPEKKEKTSVMKEILAFVRKPSKRVTTRTGRFAAAFSRAESGSSSGPLIRQSTFSCSPAAASTAAKSAVTKQMSEIGFEPKMSLKFSLNTKMSLKLRRSTAPDEKKKEKRSSGDESSTTEGETKTEQVGGVTDAPFELANVHFEKVGESYIKHEQIREEPCEEGSPIQIVALSNENAQNQLNDTESSNDRDVEDESMKKDSSDIDSSDVKLISDRDESDETEKEIKSECKNDDIENLKTTLEEHLVVKPEPIYANLLDLRSDSRPPSGPEKTDSTEGGDTEIKLGVSSIPLQCPTFEIEPPSRRSSFDPPRSPYLENLRSPGVDTDTELIHLNRLDSGGDSFEMVDPDRNRESSFEDRYSSRDTSFDISRYQSTSYEDQTSSFEIVDMDSRADDKKSNIDLRKSSIELVDAETFQKSGSSGRKSSLETHFDYNPLDGTPSTSKAVFPTKKKHKSELPRNRDPHILPYTGPSRARSPLSAQTSSNYSSRDSYDSSSSCQPSLHHDPRSPFTDPKSPYSDLRSPYSDASRSHFPLISKTSEEIRYFLCTDQRHPSTSESRSPRSPRPASSLLGQGTSSGSEFEPPSPRRAASASPKHTFTFRIVLKKVDSSPDAICPSAERRSRDRTDKHKRRDSRRKRLADVGKSF